MKTSYYGNDSVVSATAYAYNTLGEKISTETKDSRGVVYKEQIQYVGDIIAGDRTKCRNCNGRPGIFWLLL